MKTLKKVLKVLSGRLFVSAILILIQLAAYFFILYRLSAYSQAIYAAMVIVSLFFVVAVVGDDINPTFKVAWIIALLTLPFFGWMLYLIFGRRKISMQKQKLYRSLEKEWNGWHSNYDNTLEELKEIDGNVYKQCKFISSTANTAVFKGTQTKFFGTGEAFFRDFKIELSRAEKFIFLEYFIINTGEMWDEIFKILKEKIVEGVEIRVFYDDLGTIQILPKDFKKQLESYGIKVCVFNPMKPSLDVFLNYRDHRKIAVIDGKVAYTGGINIADEYVNYIERFGYWKDFAIKISGGAVCGMTQMFLELWEFSSSRQSTNSSVYMNSYNCVNDGYIMPFGAGPMNRNLTGEMAYINMLSCAEKYAYITTPYLILDNEMVTALKIAAKCGVDVRIVTPNIPDKWYVHAVTRSNYEALVTAGVKIYEYKKGFIHGKSIISDDKTAIVGTTNFDFRSFYLHFENGVFIYNSSVLPEIKKSYLEILGECVEITESDVVKYSPVRKFYYSFMKLFSPFL